MADALAPRVSGLSFRMEASVARGVGGKPASNPSLYRGP
jgi:hypothetical protein